MSITPKVHGDYNNPIAEFPIYASQLHVILRRLSLRRDIERFVVLGSEDYPSGANFEVVKVGITVNLSTHHEYFIRVLKDPDLPEVQQSVCRKVEDLVTGYRQ